MSTSKKIKTDNNNKIFQDVIDFEILKSIINYLLISKKNNKNNNTINQYKISKFYLNRNEILNYILVSKKWYNFISLTISNNIINNKSFEHWLEINYNKNKSFTENYNNQNQYDKNNLVFYSKDDGEFYVHKHNNISFNKEFSIIKIKESIINDYLKNNLFLDKITIDDFKEIKNKFENNQLLYNRIVVNFCRNNDDTQMTTYKYGEVHYFKDQYKILFKIHEYVSNENSETISNLFKVLELNHDFELDKIYNPKSEKDNKGNKKPTTELYLNSLSIVGYDWSKDEDDDEETVKIFKIFKGKNLIYDGSDIQHEISTHVNYSALFDPDNSGQQVESIKVKSERGNDEYVEARHLIKINQFENLHSITIPINSFQILSNLSDDKMVFYQFHRYDTDPDNSDNMKSELNQMINSLITCKSLKNLKILCVNSKNYSIDFERLVGGDKVSPYEINKTIESFSNSFKPLFSELNSSIERIEFDCMGLLNINTFSNLLNNKSIKYLYLYDDSDFFVYSSKASDNGGGNELHKEPISINQYLLENIFSSPLTSIRHYRICFRESKQLKFIFNLILNNIFKLHLYSLIFEFCENEIVGEFVKEYKNLINNISTQQQQQEEQQKSNNINLKEIKIKIITPFEYEEYIQELNNINNPYFATVIKKIITDC
ncbi:hypothetical protein DDB_G0271214 [Dictyostelium discoideum AX4]|uniref:Uncharacterized protein n=1 Tax=Dictyostelium discoideum TaxID=44689 RepID=Q55B83_DICDI|nr:hypothetical protein DDB_G0271214 [Dictyostelium discoideum AX4]EAL71737.1 hypothetical protein DDB_G0271214 [Dictyostelium discoideum AX4]|eukprot:XP_645729.1 hypothetical protein DDB_G0271214 [Dictyostelium discoideum AX4]